MSEGVVALLRERAAQYGHRFAPITLDNIAADEIERLRALLRDVAASRVIYPADWLDRVFDVQVEADTWAALDEFRTDHHDQEQ